MVNTLLSRYQQNIEAQGYQEDASQKAAIERLQRLSDELQKQANTSKHAGWLKSFFMSKSVCEPVTGVYLWGGVGRGKTYIMDIFYECLPFENKMRAHFHRFMRRVHSELKLLESEKNPLEKVADRLSDEARVICFDEFFVSDITDAMILANLLKALFERGVALVATSNIVPDRLYENGLQRSAFLPAIALLNKYTDVINLDSGTDYRLRTLVSAHLYHAPLSEESDKALYGYFDQLSPDSNAVRMNEPLEVEGRRILARYEADDVVWFDFLALCDGPRSQNDYIVLSKEYHTVLVSGVPVFKAANDDQARRFINLVDEFYDRRVKLILSAEKPLLELYCGGRLAFEFQRTISRLQEMQSKEYLAEAHRA